MGIFDKLKKGKEKTKPAKEQSQKQIFQQDLSQEMDPAVRPGGVFMVQLLMKEHCETPSNERLLEVLSKHLGNVEQYGDRKLCVNFAANDYISETKDASMPVSLVIFDCDQFLADGLFGGIGGVVSTV